MSYKIIVLFILLVASAFYLGSVEPKEYPAPPPAVLDDVNEDTLFVHLNGYRGNNNLPILIKSDELCSIALIRLEDMQTDFSHDKFYERVAYASYTKIGENLSRGFIHESEIMSKWIHSPLHKENLDYPYTEACIKCDTPYCVLLLAH